MSKSTVKLECLVSELGQVSNALTMLAESLEGEHSVKCGAKEEVAALALWNRVEMYVEAIYLIRRSLDTTMVDMDLEIDDLPAVIPDKAS